MAGRNSRRFGRGPQWGLQFGVVLVVAVIAAIVAGQALNMVGTPVRESAVTTLSTASWRGPEMQAIAVIGLIALFVGGFTLANARRRPRLQNRSS